MTSIFSLLLSPPPFLWDFAIVLLLGLSLSLIVVSIVWLRRRRAVHWFPKLIVLFLGFFGFLGFLAVAYGSFVEPQRITITHHTIDLPVRQTLRIAVVSDLHVGPYKGTAFLERLVERINLLFPDIILLPGDFIYDDTSSLSLLSPLAKLRASIGVFAVLGNHDTGHNLSLLRSPTVSTDLSAEIADVLEDLGITVLQNSHRIFSLTSGRIALAGVSDLWAGHSDVSAAVADLPPLTPTILLAHQPDVSLDPKSLAAHLIVAGHTHGGQIRLPWIGPLAPLPTRLGRHYDQGLFHLDQDTTLAITRGAGESFARARLFAPPEILLLTAGPRLNPLGQ